MTDIEHVPLSAEQLDFCLQIMRKGNLLRRKWSVYYGFRKARKFRQLLFNGDNNPAGCIPQSKMKKFSEDIPAMVTAIRVDKHPELDNRTVEIAMLEGHIRLINRLAWRWYRHNGSATMDLHDFIQEGRMALIDAVYGYTKKNIKFITFSWIVLKNRLINRTSMDNPLSPFNTKDSELLIRYEQAKMDFCERVSFDKLTEYLELTDDEKKNLNHMLTKVISESQMAPSNTNEVKENEDYTALRRECKKPFDPILKMNVQAAIKTADLTPFERAVLEHSMNDYYGWQTYVAKQYINPNTGKPYSRMGTNVALKNARRKVREQLEHLEPELAQ